MKNIGIDTKNPDIVKQKRMQLVVVSNRVTALCVPLVSFVLSFLLILFRIFNQEKRFDIKNNFFKTVQAKTAAVNVTQKRKPYRQTTIHPH